MSTMCNNKNAYIDSHQAHLGLDGVLSKAKTKPHHIHLPTHPTHTHTHSYSHTPILNHSFCTKQKVTDQSGLEKHCVAEAIESISWLGNQHA